MSREVEAVGLIAAPVVLAAAAAYGAGWLAWQSGKLLVDTGRAINRQVEEKKRQLEEEARHRKMSALAAHRQLVDMCKQVLAQLESEADSAEFEQFKFDLKKICAETLPDDVQQIESLTSLGYLKLDRVVRQQSRIAALQLSDSDAGLYHGLSVADLMDGLRIAIGAMEIKATVGTDVKAADPAVLERVKLNEAFVTVTNRIMTALADADDLTQTYGLTDAASAWLHSCFNGVDGEIEALCRPTTSNKELKKGIQRLEGRMEQYDMMAPSIEKEAQQMQALYRVYVEGSQALCESIESIKAFKSVAELEEKLKYLQTRAAKAEECAQIYQKLGQSAYLSYAWDRELQEMGYAVHTRKEIMELANAKPEHAKIGENKLPFYQWSEEDMTQLYAVTSDCALQVVVHDDGTVSMETFAEDETEDAVTAQRSHCARMKELHERLKKNWFISYDFKETEEPEKVMTTAAWRASDENAWKKSNELITDQRAKGKTVEKAKQMQ